MFDLNETPALAKEAEYRVLTEEEKEMISDCAEKEYEAGNIELMDFISYTIKHVPIPADEALYDAKIIGFRALKGSGANLLEASVVFGKDWHEGL